MREMPLSISRLPIHVGLHFMGAAETTADGSVRVHSVFGSLVECVAERVGHLDLVAYAPPPAANESFDICDHNVSAKNVSVISLGEKGTRRDRAARRRHTRDVVGPASERWDMVIFRLVNRRADLVFDANRCERIVSILGGYEPGAVRRSGTRTIRQLAAVLFAYRSEHVVRRIAGASGVFFVNSEELLERYQRAFPHARLVRTSTRRRTSEHHAGDRMNGDHLRLGFVGRIHRSKGAFDAVDALALIREEIDHGAHLDMIGTGEDLPHVSGYARTLGVEHAVTFHGWVPSGEELGRLYASLDVLLFLSHWESMPRVVWEAMAHSVLVVSTDVGSLSRVFSHAEEILYTPVGDAGSVLEAVRWLSEDGDLRRSMLARAFARRDESTVDGSVDAMLEAACARWPELRRMAG